MTTRAYFEAARIATPQGLTPVVAASDVTSVPTRGTGLSGELFLPASDISTLADAEATVCKVPDARFVAPRLSHSTVDDGGMLAEGLGPVAFAKITAREIGSSALSLSGFVFIPAGVHEIEVTSSGGVRLDLGGQDFIETEASDTTETAAYAADFQGGLYEIDLLAFAGSGLVSLGLRIDGLPVDRSAFFRCTDDFLSPPEGTALIPVEAYHPSFFLGASVARAPDPASWTAEGDDPDEFGDDDMILGLDLDGPTATVADDILTRRAADHGRDREHRPDGPVTRALLKHIGQRQRPRKTRVDAARVALPEARVRATPMLQWVRGMVRNEALVINNAMQVDGIRPMRVRFPGDGQRLATPPAPAAPITPPETRRSAAADRTPPRAPAPTAAKTAKTALFPRDAARTTAHPWLQQGAVALACSLMGSMEPPVVLMAHEGGDFSGPNQPVRVPHTPIHATRTGTLSFVFTAFTPGNDQTQTLFSKVSLEGPESGHLIAYLRGDGVLKIEFHGEDDQISLFDSGVTIAARERYHLAFSFEEDEINLYLNGELVDSDIGCPGGMLANAEETVIGAAKGHGTGDDATLRWHFNGSIANVLLLDRAIADVEAVFLAQAAGDITGIDALYGLEDEDENGEEPTTAAPSVAVPEPTPGETEPGETGRPAAGPAAIPQHPVALRNLTPSRRKRSGSTARTVKRATRTVLQKTASTGPETPKTAAPTLRAEKDTGRTRRPVKPTGARPARKKTRRLKG